MTTPDAVHARALARHAALRRELEDDGEAAAPTDCGETKGDDALDDKPTPQRGPVPQDAAPAPVRERVTA